MQDELWIEKELERIRQEFSLTDEQFKQFREQRSLESQITQERIKEIHQLLESTPVQITVVEKLLNAVTLHRDIV